MGQIRKRGEAGQAKNYITRSQAIKKLQISLPDFRKLLIFRGIYPREPANRKKVSKSSTASTTFYYTKDIQYLLHEPLLQKFRDQRTLEKKISKALGRGDVSDAKRLEQNAARPEKTGKPRYTLNHIIRERYPTFTDALRDLDDCLSMLFLFANLPSTSAVPAKMIARCEKLCWEFQHYLIASHSLRKSFLSIKGIYYQANIQGEEVLWLVPYKFNQRVVGDIDFRIMQTFVEFYMTLLGFVNYRLYTAIGLKYPPKFDATKDDLAGELGAFTLEGANFATQDEQPQAITNGSAEHGPDPKVQAEVDEVVKQLKDSESKDDERSQETEVDETLANVIDKFEPAVEGGDVLLQPTNSASDPAALFSNCTFFLSRETPRQSLEFILKAFGCKRIGWDSVLGEGAFTTNELDSTITHQIVDRPVVQAAVTSEGDGEDNQTSQKLGPNQRVPGRIYVQPQWVWDCVNDEELKRPELYAPGTELPPHMSPFVKSLAGRYDPRVPLEEQELEGEALEAELDEGEDEEEGEEGSDGDEVDNDAEAAEEDEDVDNNGMHVASSGDEEEEADEEDVGSFDGFSEGEQEENSDDDEAAARQLELEAEGSGRQVKPLNTEDPQKQSKLDARKALQRKAKDEAEELERRKGMLSKKKRKQFEQMEYSNNKKSAEDLKLRAKRRKMEQDQAKKTKKKA